MTLELSRTSFLEINVDSCQLTLCFNFSAYSPWESGCGLRLSLFIPMISFAYISVGELDSSTYIHPNILLLCGAYEECQIYIFVYVTLEIISMFLE